MSSSDLPEAGARLTLDLSEWESNWSSVMGDAEELQSTIDDLSGSVDVEFNVDDSALPFDEIPDSTETDVETTQSEDSKKVVEGITFLATMKKIETVINVIGTAVDFVKDIGALTVAPFLDVEDAVAKINAQTGGTGIADLGQLIRDIQAADLGDSVQQIGDVVIAAQQLNLPIKEAATAALTFTHTFKNEDPTTVLDALNNLVKTGLVPNLQAAADLMTVAFQQGVNKSGDALNVVKEYGQAFSDMKLNGSEAMSLINSLMDNGVATAGEAAKMILTVDDAFTTAAANADSPQAQAIAMLGIENPKEQGLAIGSATIDGIAEAFSTLPSDQQDLVSGLLFGKGGKKFTGAIAGMTTQGGPFADVVGAASDAATEIDNSLRGAIDDFVLAINTKIQELLSSDAIDLPGKIKALKEGLQEGLDVLSKGGTVGEALEVALNVPGLSKTLDTFIGNFERIVGNIEIAFLQIVASIQDITGHGKEAAGTRATIVGLSKKQLAFDLQLGNPDEIATQVSQAVSRGVSNKDAGDAITTALNETIANANFGQGANILQGLLKGVVDEGSSPDAVAAFNDLAGKYVTNLSNGFDNALSAGNLDLAQKMLTIQPNAKIPGLDEAVAGFQKQLSDAFAPHGGADTGNPFTSGMFAGTGKEAATSNSLLGGITTQVTDFADKVTAGGDTAGLAFEKIGTTASTMSDTVGTSMDESTASVEGLALQAQIADTDIAAAMTGNTVTASFEAVATAADESFPGVIEWFNRTSQAAAQFDASLSGHIQHILNMLHDLQFLSAQVSTGIQSALTLGAGLQGAGGNTTNNNVTVNNSFSTTAGAVANGYAIGRSLRPGGA